MTTHDSENFLVSYQTKGKLPSLPFVDMKNAILGKKYDLSLACVNKTKAQSLNTLYRKKTYVPNILSFPLDDSSGELILHIPTIKKEYKKFGLSYEGYVGYLFIHGCLHLKGYDHGTEMDRLEEKFKKKYTIV